MSVIFGFLAFKDKYAEPVDSINDWGKTLTNDMLLTVPRSIEELRTYGDAESHIYRYHDYFTEMAPYGFTEKDLDFLMYTDSSAYSGVKSTHFFDSKECYDKFIKFTDYFKGFNLTLYESCKEDIEKFANFFLKHGNEKHFVRGYWS